LPKGLVPNLKKLIDDQKAQQQAMNDQNSIMNQFAEQYPAEYGQMVDMPPEKQQEILQQIMYSEEGM
jgi:hypothetical protein